MLEFVIGTLHSSVNYVITKQDFDCALSIIAEEAWRQIGLSHRALFLYHSILGKANDRGVQAKEMI